MRHIMRCGTAVMLGAALSRPTDPLQLSHQRADDLGSTSKYQHIIYGVWYAALYICSVLLYVRHNRQKGFPQWETTVTVERYARFQLQPNPSAFKKAAK